MSASDLGVAPDTATDHSAALQSAIDAAAHRGVPLFLEAGTYIAQNLALPSNIKILGVPGATVLQAARPGQILTCSEQTNISLDGVAFSGSTGGAEAEDLVSFRTCSNLNLTRLDFRQGSGNGLRLEVCQGKVSDSRFRHFGESAIHAQNSAGLNLSNNTIRDCANGGIRVWRYDRGDDATIVAGNQISGIGSQSGNGQNGNGINVFRADGVIVSANSISDCDFSAIRANATTDTVIQGNNCSDCREVAIFSEFAFTGSIVADNIIDGAAAGISVTNFDQGGRLAIVSNNIVRNITSSSPTNPDTRPLGIHAQANAAVTGNAVDEVPGVGILAGWGPYLDNVLVNGNVVRGCDIGIAASVAEGAGPARIANNMISGSKRAGLAGMRWQEIAAADLDRNPDQFGNLTVEGNTVS